MEKNNFAFGKKNYILSGISVLLIVVGFLLMSGGGAKDPSEFSPEIFSATRIKVAPVVVMSGFILMIVAILINGRKPEEVSGSEKE